MKRKFILQKKRLRILKRSTERQKQISRKIQNVSLKKENKTFLKNNTLDVYWYGQSDKEIMGNILIINFLILKNIVKRINN